MRHLDCCDICWAIGLVAPNSATLDGDVIFNCVIKFFG